MKSIDLAQISLQCRLSLTRFGWGNSLVGVLFVTVAVVWAWAIPQLDRQVADSQRELVKTKKMLDSTPAVAKVVLPQSEQRLLHFYEMLGESRYVEQQVKTVLAIADKNGLTINQVDYKFATNTNGLYQTYSISLPVKGPYGSIRHFCEQVLLSIPFASLDEIDFKRDAVSNATLDTKLRFTLHLDNGKVAPNGAKHVVGGEL